MSYPSRAEDLVNTAMTYIYQLWADTRYSLEDQPEAMNDTQGWQERESLGTPYCHCDKMKYIYVCVCVCVWELLNIHQAIYVNKHNDTHLGISEVMSSVIGDYLVFLNICNEYHSNECFSVWQKTQLITHLNILKSVVLTMQGPFSYKQRERERERERESFLLDSNCFFPLSSSSSLLSTQFLLLLCPLIFNYFFELQKNARNCFREILEATPHETIAVRPLTSYLKNHASKTCRTQLYKQGWIN